MDLKQSTIDGSNRPMTDDKLNTSFSVIIIMAKLANPFQLTRLIKLHCLTNTIDLTLKMTFAQVVKTSVTNNSSFQNYPHPDDHTMRTTDTPGFKPFTKILVQLRPKNNFIQQQYLFNFGQNYFQSTMIIIQLLPCIVTPTYLL